MTDLTAQEILDAIDRALERVEQGFAASRPKSGVAPEREAAKRPGRSKSKRKLDSSGVI
jgi:hypothetical protein